MESNEDARVEIDRTRHLQRAMSLDKMPAVPGLRPPCKEGGNPLGHFRRSNAVLQADAAAKLVSNRPKLVSLGKAPTPNASLTELEDHKTALLEQYKSVEEQLAIKRELTSADKKGGRVGRTDSSDSLLHCKSTPNLRVQPRWLKHDKDVLRFFTFFREPVFESALETFRIRRCELLYFLENGDVAVNEPKEQNSGLPQGVLVKRMPLTHEDGSTFDPTEFCIGQELSIFRVRYRIVDVDEKTRLWLAERGIEAGAPEPYPEDPHRRMLSRAGIGNKNTSIPALQGQQLGDHAEPPSDGAGSMAPSKGTLRISCVWDDSSRLYGDKHFFQLNYYLADDTIAIYEVGVASTLYKRSKLLVDKENLTKGFVQPSDLVCGRYIACNGRKLLLLKCLDEFTRAYFQRVFGISQPMVDVAKPPAKVVTKVIPPYNGWGSEADSLANCINLVPKAVTQDLHRYLNNSGKVLKFSACLVAPKPEDEGRKFLISYYMDDDTCAIYEPPIPNSGIVGGKFLARGRYKKPVLEKKIIDVAAQQSLKDAILEKIQSRMVGGPYGLLRAFRKFGTDEHGCISFDNFRIGLRSIGVLPAAFADEELRALFSMYDHSGDDAIDYKEFVEQVMQDKAVAANASRYSARYIRSSDFYIGTRIQFMFPQTGACTQEFEITSADKDTLDLMEDHPDLFPQSNVEVIATMLAEVLEENHVNVTEAFRVIDRENKGYIHPSQLGELVAKWALDFGLIGEQLTKHERLTLVRHYDRDGDGRIYYHEFAAALRKSKPLYSSGMGSTERVTKAGSPVAATFEAATSALFQKLSTLRNAQTNLFAKFKEIDENGSGAVSWDEFRNMLRRFDIYLNNERDKLTLMRLFDVDADGLIRYEELLEAVMSGQLPNAAGSDGAEGPDGGDPADILKYEAVVQAAQEREDATDRLRALMHVFNAAFSRRRHQLLKALSSYDIDNHGLISKANFLLAINATNPDFPSSVRDQIVDYVFRVVPVPALGIAPPGAGTTPNLDYRAFVETMLTQDIPRATALYGDLQTSS
ncbi:EF-hand domain-containing protein 1 [Hondaea fermentalgiana]|uniref:EF-hand domain-containing protein 1 n=1 Tax=Hondaea fermentalgiana TaxID=2315210 RepID=A0A2R5G4U5_9STRA|nr:EF-hand domain-containing protein 1 [Hondaea fermentalgiana]|eukprot:GBG26047.1 EF-hand domain-containing protein 1 [Hondaea fermentalgiana]